MGSLPHFISNHFIGLNAIVVIILIMSFLRARRSAQNARIKFRYEPRKQVIVKKVVVEEGAGIGGGGGGGGGGLKRPSGPKALNVMFNYNGHTWDAYEVLGVPAGSNFENSFLAFEKLTKAMDPESKGFMLAALEAIRKERAGD